MGIADGYDPDEWSRNADWRPSEVDTTRASAARMYDYYLGGSHHFEVDRDKAKEVLAVLPEARAFARNNRAFLRRVVRYGVEQGIRQFLDLGSGLPTVGNVHETAQAHSTTPHRSCSMSKSPVSHRTARRQGTP